MTTHQPLLIHNARIITADSVYARGWLLAENGKIARMAAGDAPEFETVDTIDAHGRTLLPGFIDVHVHGAHGREAMDAIPDSLKRMAQDYAEHGVTGFLPTTWTASAERIRAALEAIGAMQGVVDGGAAILGAHLEGPYLNPAKCGAQDTTQIRRATQTEALPLLDLNVIRLLALAPEYDENLWLIDECVNRGITVSAAHTDATYSDMGRAVAHGLSQTTHTYNAMRGLHHREPGTVGAALTMPELRCELIGDGLHVHPASMKLLWQAKGADGVILITDAVRGAGLPDGSSYTQDGRTVTLRDGSAYLDDGTLAGSTLSMDIAVRTFMQATGEPLDAIWQATSLNAARALSIDHCKGSLAIGKDADLVLVDDAVNVCLTVVEGRVVYET